jgi:hypothetical protein
MYTIMVTAEEARRLRVNKGAVNHETYKEIYRKVSGRITAAASRGETSLEYRVPPLIPGRPMYNITHAVRYNVDKLRHNGFEVLPDDDILYVNWKTDTAPPPAKTKKKQPPQLQQPPQPPAPSSGFKSSASISAKLQELKHKLKL